MKPLLNTVFNFLVKMIVTIPRRDVAALYHLNRIRLIFFCFWFDFDCYYDAHLNSEKMSQTPDYSYRAQVENCKKIAVFKLHWTNKSWLEDVLSFTSAHCQKCLCKRMEKRDVAWRRNRGVTPQPWRDAATGIRQFERPCFAKRLNFFGNGQYLQCDRFGWFSTFVRWRRAILFCVKKNKAGWDLSHFCCCRGQLCFIYCRGGGDDRIVRQDGRRATMPN
jgi:hypothetical protein